MTICDDGLGEYGHWGATTQDIMDTALAVQLECAFSLIDTELAHIGARLGSLAERYRGTVMPGRSQQQHALPVTFGFKAAVWLAAIDRHRSRLAELRPRVEMGQLGGAVGTLASLGERGLDVQAALCAELGLGEPVITWHTSRDTLAETVGFLAILTGTLAKIGRDVALMSQTEVGEVAEGGGAAGRGASSTMPQKRNPISAQGLIAAHQAVSRNAGLMLAALPQDHERATGLWHMEWFAIPEAFVLAGGAVRTALVLLEGLQVDSERMHSNLGVTNGAIMTEAVMMALAPRVGRQRAHDWVAEAVRDAQARQSSIRDALLEHGGVSVHLTADQITDLLEPTSYLGESDRLISRVLARR